MKTQSSQNKQVGIIASFGETTYSIVYGAGASAAQRYAANELHYFLLKITGADLPIVADDDLKWDKDKTYISIGKTVLLEKAGIQFDYSVLNKDGFFIKTVGKSLFINGFNDRGIIYGVYDFLEVTTGLRFVAYDCTYIPKLTQLCLYETDRTEIPAFEYRGYFANVTFQENTDEAFTVRMRMNYSYANISKERGGKIGWYKAEGMEPTHNALWWVPPGDRSDSDALINTCPEFFVMGQDGITPVDICWTYGITDDGRIDESIENSPIKTAIRNMKKAAASAPENIDVFSFGIMDTPADGSDSKCRCRRCREAAEKYKWSGIVIRFMNILADEMKKFAQEELGGRDIKIVTLAYERTIAAPVKDGVLIDPLCKPRDNVYILIAPYFGDFFRDYKDPRQVPELRKLFADWEIVHNKFFLWAYAIANNSTFNNGLFYFNNQRIWHGLFRHMKELGVTYMTMQGQYVDRHHFQSNFDCYVASKMMWNPDLDVNSLREEYIRLYYGPAAPFVSRVINRFDAYYAMEADYNGLNYRQDRQDVRLQAKYHPYAFLQSQVDLLNLGLTTLQLPSSITRLTEEEKPLIARRVKEIRIQTQYLILLFYEDYFPGKSYEKKLYAKALFDDCEEIGLKMVAEYQSLDLARALFGIDK